MNEHVAKPDQPELLTFYCRDCDFVFDSLPDGTGYEQVECPKCNAVCMTVAFERGEQERHRNEATFFSLLGSLTGLFGIHVPGSRQQRAAFEPVMIAAYEELLDAEKDAELLDGHGIESALEVNGAANLSWASAANVCRIELRVSPADAQRAKEILCETDPPLPPEARPRPSLAEITFACEECGETISFPGQCRGKVETCPCCHEYVDVPDD